MELRDAVVVITGGGSGIGAALARRFVTAGARSVIVTDVDAAAAAAVAGPIGALAVPLDVTDPAAIAALVEQVVAEHGRIDLFCSNAGVAFGGGLDASPEVWQRAWDVNLMAHVHAAKAVVPVMTGQGGGYLLQTCSAAGLLTAPGDPSYTATKHAAVAFAEWLAVTYASVGIKVSALCPLGVSTPLLMQPLAAGDTAAAVVAASGPIITADQVADTVVEGLRAERFLILPHPQVATYWARKAADPGRWLAAMADLVAPTTP
jgi:NAD(P)-dependent dehydrogenase (short-subunit alcohol dehydrogenase family)